jgi:Protein of unknown function DUF262
MNISSPTYPVADYIAMLDRGEVTVNRRYQRSGKVWPTAARSFLIETILLSFPIPKLSLHQQTDVKNFRATKQVVDGQQRTFAMRDFMHDEFRLSPRLELEEARGKRFSQLADALKAQFMNYSLNFDLFVGATDEEVREVFRRMNSFTVPLNPEEQRHATFQGPFKWFIYELSNEYSEAFRRSGVFGDRALIRMADAKLLTEVCDAVFDGIRTTTKAHLEALYESRNKDFPEEQELGRRLRAGLDHALAYEDFYGTELMKKQHVFYALVLAAMHVREPIDALSEQIELRGKPVRRLQVVEALTELCSALEEDDLNGRYGEFVEAASEQTNVGKQRVKRVQWLCDALTGTLG